MTAKLKEALREVVRTLVECAVETNPGRAFPIEEAEMHFHAALAEEPTDKTK